MSQHDTYRTLAFLGTGLVTPMQNQLWQGAIKAAREYGARLVYYPVISLSSSPVFTPQSKVLFDFISDETLDGLIIWYAGIAEGVGISECLKLPDRYKPLPIVTVGGQLPDIPDLSIDNYQGVYAAVEHLILVHGRRRIATIHGPVGHPDADARYRGYVDALRAHGFSPDPYYIAESLFEPGNAAMMVKAAINRWLQNPGTCPDAIVAASDYIAIEVVKAVETRGLNIPDDIAVVGFDDIDNCRASIPSMTTVRQPFEYLGYQSVKTLLALVNHEPVPLRSIMPAQFIVRESCGCLTDFMGSGNLDTQKLPEMTISTVAARIAHDLGMPIELAEGMVQALQEDLRSGTSHHFLTALNRRLAEDIKSRFDTAAWRNAFSVLRQYMRSLNEIGTSGETLFEQVHAMLADVSQRISIRQQIQSEHQIEDLSRTSEALITAFGTQLLIDNLYEQLPALGFPSFYLFLYDDPAHPAEWSHLILAYDDGERIDLPSEEQRFPTRQLIPVSLPASRRTAPIVIEPLYFRDQQLGILVLEVGPTEGLIYENLRAQISSALQGSQLLHQVQQHAAELEQSVAQRTAELSHTVALLRSEIAERQMVEDSLRKSEARYRALIDSQNDLISRYLPDTTLTFVNDAYCEFYGKTREELIGQSYLTMVAPEFHEVTRQEALKMAENPTTVSGEYLNYRYDGKPCWIQWTIKGILDENGQVVEIQAVGHDITPLKQAEAALRESEFFLQKSQTVGRIGSYYLHVGTDTWVSSPMLDVIFGIGEHYPKNTEGWIALVHPEQKEEMLRYFQEDVLAGHHRFDKEYRIIRSEDQQELWVHGFGELEYDDQNRAITMIGTIQDITQRKRAELALRESEELAREFQQKLKALQTISLELGGYTSLEQLCRRAIELGRDSLGYDRIGLLLFDNAERSSVSRFGIESSGELRVETGMSYIAEKDGANSVLADREYIYVNEDAVLGDFEGPVGRGWNVVTGIWDADTCIGWLAADNFFSRKPLRPYQVELLKLYGLTLGHAITSKRDEAEIHRLNDELERRVIQRTQQLELVNRELESFAYSVSHDLRAPLRSIDGFSQALLEDYRDRLDEEGQDHLRRVRQATIRMGKLIDDMLQLSRVSRREMQSETVDLSMIAEHIASSLRETQPERNIEWVIQPGIKVQGDSGLLRVALENLLRNAWKFTGKHERARIEFGCEQQDGQRVFFVRDDGAGFDMSYINKLFGAFQRLHRADEFEGTGIGLATVQRIIQRHGGRIWARGEVEQGATFFFIIPPKS